MPVRLQDIVAALESAADEHSYYLDKRTGEIILLSNEELEAAEEDELISEYPAWQRESILKAREVLANEDNNFLALPEKFDIDEYQIMADFCREFQDRVIGERLLRLIKGSGAFGRFKNEIFSLGIEKRWFDFKRTAFEEIALEWLRDHKVPFTRQDDDEVAESQLEV